MDDVTFAARRAGSVTRGEADVESRFRALVQSPLRAGILRFLSARPGERFDIESLMQTFGRMRLDVENCVKELVDFGVVARTAGEPVTFGNVLFTGDRVSGHWTTSPALVSLAAVALDAMLG